jgi:hypothetical protein
MKSRREQYEQIRAALWSDRTGGGFDDHWRDLADYIFPRRTRFWTGDRNKGDKRNQKIIDSTGRFSARTLQSGLHAGLTSPARPWMKLTTPDPDLAEHGPVKEWLHTVTARMLTVFLQTNLYNALPIVYGDMGTFGTAAMAVLTDAKDVFRCYTFPLGSYALGVDARGQVATFVREYQLTVRALVETFGGERGERLERGHTPNWSGISQTVKDLWIRGNYEAAVDVCWVVKPNDLEDAERLGSKYLPWASCHFERTAPPADEKFLRESGFRTMAVIAPRWEVGSAEDAYGIDCPGMTALGDIKGLQVMQRKKAQAINKMVDPPLTGPSSLKAQKTSLLPGDITYLDVRDGQQGLKSIHDVTLRIDHLGVDIRETQYRIQRAYFEDLFLMLANSDPARGTQPITAREVEERHEEKLLALGPVLERTNDELLDPLVDRTFALLEEAGLIPPPPSELDGVRLKVEYLSILAQAQKLVGVVGQDRFLQSIIPLEQLAGPALRHKVRWNRIIDNYGDMLGVDPRVIVPDAEADAAAQEEARQAQAQAESEQAKNYATAAHAAANAPMDTDNALTRLTRNLGASGG